MAIPKRLRKPLIPAMVALVALGVWAEIWYSQRLTSRENAARESVVAPTATPEPSLLATIAPTTTPAPTAKTFTPPDEEALRELDRVSLMIRDYRTLAGENPVGTNAEIMAAMMGDNPKHATLGPPDGMKLNENGELLDRWGTPYFFHQISKDHMEIRSAGPDKILWTDDDPVMK